MKQQHSFSFIILFFCSSFCCTTVKSQTALSTNDLSSFQTPPKNWLIEGDVTADVKEYGRLKISEGKGILVNMPDKNTAAGDLYSNLQHGDIDIELEYMMAKGSNSGIYLQGRYEVQLLDSWGVLNPKPGDNGGIYDRWEEARGKGNEGYEGYAPRQNASRAPGLWQHLVISFQAPRFNASGRKIENARMISVQLNGVTIHENIELSGPTRGAMKNDEVPMGPLRIQGDHGAVAFRNIVYKNYDKPGPVLSDLSYKIYKGKFEKEPDFLKLTPEEQGSAVIITTDVNKIDNEFIIRYSGILTVKEAGEYNFRLNASGGGGMLRINKQVVVPETGWGTGKINLPEGKLPFELLYSKFVSWNKAALGLAIAGPGIREYLLSNSHTSGDEVPDPILVEATTNTTLRSFMDIKGSERITHAINVGSPQQLHYTYDLDWGMIVQAWRGHFLDATPMWHDRGDGSSRPAGTILYFGAPNFFIENLSTVQSPWVRDTAGSSFRTKGYSMDEKDRPTFMYLIAGIEVTDATTILENGEGLRREINVKNAAANCYARLAEGKNIELVSDGFYLVDDKSYYLRIDDTGSATPFIRDINGRKELLIPVQSKLIYSVLF